MSLEIMFSSAISRKSTHLFYSLKYRIRKSIPWPVTITIHNKSLKLKTERITILSRLGNFILTIHLDCTCSYKYLFSSTNSIKSFGTTKIEPEEKVPRQVVQWKLVIVTAFRENF